MDLHIIHSLVSLSLTDSPSSGDVILCIHVNVALGITADLSRSSTTLYVDGCKTSA
jgi:hypothetical protein